jgi:hypothetical protein
MTHNPSHGLTHRSSHSKTHGRTYVHPACPQAQTQVRELRPQMVKSL